MCKLSFLFVLRCVRAPLIDAFLLLFFVFCVSVYVFVFRLCMIRLCVRVFILCSVCGVCAFSLVLCAWFVFVCVGVCRFVVLLVYDCIVCVFFPCLMCAVCVRPCCVCVVFGVVCVVCVFVGLYILV